MIDETIAAISTAMSPGGIGIVRITGNNAINIANKIWNNDIYLYKSHTSHYGYVIDKNKNIVDEALLIVMKAPNSYTKLDVVEIQCHGGIFIVKKILNLVLEMGARLAEPGEFTKLAFLNGRIDLSQAESVMDLINSKSELSRISSINQLRGNVKNKIETIYKKLVNKTAFIETVIDDPEHFENEMDKNELKVELKFIIKELDDLIRKSQIGKILRNGIPVAIVGKPNAGKSSLLNSILGENRAIVTDMEGTTRDVIVENINIGMINLSLIDTAGIRESNNKIEKIGIEKTREEIKKAELVIFVIDSTKDIDIDFLIEETKKAKNIIFAINKIDLNNDYNDNYLKNIADGKYKIVPISAKTGEGIDKLIKVIENLYNLNEIRINDEVYISNERHVELLKNTKRSLNKVIDSINANMPEDFLTIDLIEAYTELGKITGTTSSEDLINEIFSKFCVGK